MKKIALFLAVAIAAIACKPEEEKVTPSVTVNSTEESLVIDAEGGNVEVVFDANVDWTAAFEGTTEWRVSPASGSAGTGKSVKIIAGENATDDDIKAVLVIKGQTAEAKVTITQLCKDTIRPEAETAEVPAKGGELKIKVGHNVEVTATPDVDWITVAGTKALETSELVFNVAANAGPESRTGKIVLSNGALESEVEVTQQAPAMSVEGENQTFDGNGGTFTVTVTANVNYTVAPDVDWITVSNDGDVYTFTVASGYDEPSNRTGYIWFTGEGKTLDAEGNEVDLVGSLAVTQTGTATVVWSKLTSDYEGFALGGSSRLAYWNNMLLVSTGAEVHALNAATGEYIQKIALPEGFAPNSIVNDNAGNVLVAADAAWEGTFTVFKLSKMEDLTNPTPIISYSNGDIYSATLTGLRVYGDVNGDAVVTAYAKTLSLPVYYVAWEITGGQASGAVFGSTNSARVSPAWGQGAGYICPAGSKLTDGLYYNAYIANNGYIHEYCADPAGAKTWVEAYTAVSTWESGPAAASVVEYNGKKYMACLEYTFFNYSATYAYVLDIANPAAPTQFYRADDLNLGLEALAAGAGGDILMVAGSDCLNIYAMDNGQGIIVATKIPMK